MLKFGGLGLQGGGLSSVDWGQSTVIAVRASLQPAFGHEAAARAKAIAQFDAQAKQEAMAQRGALLAERSLIGTLPNSVNFFAPP